jgi:hypothetical protein
MRRSDSMAIPAEEAGRLVSDAIRRDRFWVLPGAAAHLPLLESETAALLEAFAPDPPSAP